MAMLKACLSHHPGSILHDYDYDYDLPYLLTAPLEDLDANLDSILGSVQALLYDEEEDPCPTFDPTPLGTQGFEIVKEVKLTEIPSIENEMLMTCLYPHPLVGTSDNENERPSSSSKISRVTSSRHKIPPKKKMRRTKPFKEASSVAVDITQECEDAELSAEDSEPTRFRPYQSEQWEERFRDLIVYHKVNGHCLVLRNDTKNGPLVRWVWRQRYQQRRKEEGKHSTLTDERQVRLDQLGFVWDSHKASWEERFEELVQFQGQYGHCNANATNNPSNHQLGVWIKCQRRQYRLFLAGKKSSGMSQERISKLESVGFCFTPRRSSLSSTTSS
jgi:hypothetical protein